MGVGIRERLVRTTAAAGLAIGIAGCNSSSQESSTAQAPTPTEPHPTMTAVAPIDRVIRVAPIESYPIATPVVGHLDSLIRGHVIPADEIVSALKESGIDVPFPKIDVPENFDPYRSVVFVDAEREKYGSYGSAIRLFHKQVEEMPEVESGPSGDAVIMVVVNPIGIEAEPGSAFESSGFYKIEAMLQGIPFDVYVCKDNRCLFAFGKDVFVRVDAKTSGTDLFPVARGIGLVIDEETIQQIQPPKQ